MITLQQCTPLAHVDTTDVIMRRMSQLFRQHVIGIMVAVVSRQGAATEKSGSLPCLFVRCCIYRRNIVMNIGYFVLQISKNILQLMFAI